MKSQNSGRKCLVEIFFFKEYLYSFQQLQARKSEFFIGHILEAVAENTVFSICANMLVKR